MWLYHNFFQPVMRLKEKIVVCTAEGQPTRLKRRYDQARTPFDRVCATNAISQERQAQLEALRDQTNPRQLRQEIYALIDYVFSLPGAVPGQTEDVHQTLTTHSSPDTQPLQSALMQLDLAYAPYPQPLLRRRLRAAW